LKAVAVEFGISHMRSSEEKRASRARRREVFRAVNMSLGLELEAALGAVSHLR